ncbi:restriction endonuclease subunit S [Helicobacter pylori]|uniref:restriction endonuclease subunit S n=1 Tax=Helicobacter pylori TaxID=210 RepID=UPI000D348BB8|nr:restriction endonuclease subunit S [Helicobacter pylori]PUD61507.1 restriction endonuclease subunit S [Helicobacter pylori]
MDALTTPLNWQRVRLGTYKYRRGSFPQPYGNPQWYSDNGMPFVQVYDVGENFKLTQKTKQKISKIAQPMSVFVPKNSVIITLQGTIGRVALTQYDCYCDRTILIFDNNTLNDVNKYFFVLSLFTKFEEEKRKADGSIIKTITKQTLKDFEIPLPPLNEQIAIANILSDLDRHLYTLRVLILKKKSVKKALSFELLSQRKRLKGFNQAWQKVRLGDIANYLTSNLSAEQITQQGKIKVYDVNNFIGYTNTTFISDKPYISIVKDGSVGRVRILPPKTNILSTMGALIANHKTTTEFLFYLLSNFDFKNFTSGSIIPHIYFKDYKEKTIFLPSLNEQAAIANILSDLDSEITSLKNKKRQFENIKKALNHDLMSAKIRVLKK